MKKLLLLFLVLTGMVSTASADWYVRGTFTATTWDTSLKMTAGSDGESYTYLLEDYVVASETTYEFKVDNGSWSESYPGSNYQITIPAGTYDIFFYFNSSTHDVKCIYNVELRSSSELLGTFDRTGLGEYTLTLDLSSSLSDQYFKPVTYYGTSADWMGVGSFNGGTQITDTESLLDVTTDVGDGKGYFYILKNSNKTYKTYTFVITYDKNGWSMSVAGNDARAHTTYNFSFINNMGAGWTNVSFYVFDPIEQAAWPGTTMTKTGTATIEGTDYDLYTGSIDAYEPYPTKIIFNNTGSGSGNQVADVTVVNNETYSGPLYYVVGGAAAYGNWDPASSTAIMQHDGDGTYSLAQSDVILGKNFEFKVVKKAYYGKDIAGWLPWTGENPSLVTPVAGKYDVEFFFDPAADMESKTACVDGSNATKTYEAVTIGDEKWATTVTNSPLDFSAAAVEAYTATLSGTTVTLTKVNDVQAETGLVVKGAKDTHYIPVAASSSTDKGSLLFSSTLSYDTWGNHSFYGLAIRSGNAKFTKITHNNDVTIPARKAFLLVEDGGSGAQELNVTFDDEVGDVTGIQTLNAERNKLYGETYNLAGQKVTKSYKGLVISNGKKVVIK